VADRGKGIDNIMAVPRRKLPSQTCLHIGGWHRMVLFDHDAIDHAQARDRLCSGRVPPLVEEAHPDRKGIVRIEPDEFREGIGGVIASRGGNEQHQPVDELGPLDREVKRNHPTKAGPDHMARAIDHELDQCGGIVGVIGHRVVDRRLVSPPEPTLIEVQNPEALVER